MRRNRDRPDFGYWLDVTMANKGMTGRDLAHLVGVHDSAVSRWRAGRGVPTMEAIAKLAEVFKVEPLRLAVTAGLVTDTVAGVAPVAMPEPTAQRKEVRERLRSLPGLSRAEVQALLERYDELQTTSGGEPNE